MILDEAYGLAMGSEPSYEGSMTIVIKMPEVEDNTIEDIDSDHCDGIGYSSSETEDDDENDLGDLTGEGCCREESDDIDAESDVDESDDDEDDDEEDDELDESYLGDLSEDDYYHESDEELEDEVSDDEDGDDDEEDDELDESYLGDLSEDFISEV